VPLLPRSEPLGLWLQVGRDFGWWYALRMVRVRRASPAEIAEVGLLPPGSVAVTRDDRPAPSYLRRLPGWLRRWWWPSPARFPDQGPHQPPAGP
jgi:hypothetical protein